MNAAERANSVEFASKIAAVVGLMRAHVPDLRADLKPWLGDRETQALVDPASIDIGFHFPGVSRLFKCRSLLVQIRFCNDPAFWAAALSPAADSPAIDVEANSRAIGLEVAGFDHRGQRWRLSTIDSWQCEGDEVPAPAQTQQLKDCCRKIFELFA